MCGGQFALTCLCSDAKEPCPNQPLSRVVFLGCTPACEEGMSAQGQSLSLRVTGATQMLANTPQRAIYYSDGANSGAPGILAQLLDVQVMGPLGKSQWYFGLWGTE